MFPFFSALLGWLGVFVTGSDTSANALFGNLQVVTAQHLHMNPTLMASANSSGGVMGKMISLQSIAVASAATSMAEGEEGRLFRFTLRNRASACTAFERGKARALLSRARWFRPLAFTLLHP
jgi:L-lactate permease